MELSRQVQDQLTAAQSVVLDQRTIESIAQRVASAISMPGTPSFFGPANYHLPRAVSTATTDAAQTNNHARVRANEIDGSMTMRGPGPSQQPAAPAHVLQAVDNVGASQSTVTEQAIEISATAPPLSEAPRAASDASLATRVASAAPAFALVAGPADRVDRAAIEHV